MKKEATEIPEAAEVAEFSDVEALNTAGFAEFLAKFDDADTFDATDTEKLEIRFEAFKNKNEAAKGLSKFFESELRVQGLDIKFGDKELGTHIGERISDMASKNPEKVSEIHANLVEYNELAKEIVAAEEKINEFEDKGDLESALAESKKKREILDDALETTGRFGGIRTTLKAVYESIVSKKAVDGKKQWLAENPDANKSQIREAKDFIEANTSARRKEGARLSLENYSIKPNKEDVEKALKETEEEIMRLTAKVEGMEELEQKYIKDHSRFVEIREMLLEGVGTNEELKKIAIDKAIEHLDGLGSSDPEEAQVYFEKMKEVSDNNAFEIDYFNGKADQIQETLQAKIESHIAEEMKTTIEKTPFGNKAYDKMTKSLEGFINKQKVGSKEEEEARNFVFDTLKSVAATIGSADKARGLLLRFMLVKLEGATA